MGCSACGIACGSASNSMRLYGCCGAAKNASRVPSSSNSPAYITPTRSAFSATTPRSCVISSMPIRFSLRRLRSTSSTCAWMVTSSAVVGSSAIRSLGWPASAIAIIARWRRPPDSSNG